VRNDAEAHAIGSLRPPVRLGRGYRVTLPSQMFPFFVVEQKRSKCLAHMPFSLA